MENCDDRPDFLKDEEEKDPMTLGRELLKMAKEALGPRRAHECPPELSMAVSPPAAISIMIQTIENGYLVHHGPGYPGGHLGNYAGQPRVTYAKLPADVVELVSQLALEHLGGASDPAGTPPRRPEKAYPGDSVPEGT